MPIPAQNTKFTPDDFQRLYAAVEAKGSTVSIRAQNAALLGFLTEADVPSHQVLIGAQTDARRSISSFPIGTHKFLVFIPHQGDDSWIFLIDDGGSLTLAFHVIVHGGMHPVDVPKAQALAAGEQAYWMQWLADGAKLPPTVTIVQSQ